MQRVRYRASKSRAIESRPVAASKAAVRSGVKLVAVGVRGYNRPVLGPETCQEVHHANRNQHLDLECFRGQ